MRLLLCMVCALLAYANLVLMLWVQPDAQRIVLLLSAAVFLIQCARAGKQLLHPFFLFGLTAVIFLSGRVLTSLRLGMSSYTVGDWFYYGPLDEGVVALAMGAIGLFYCGVAFMLKPGRPWRPFPKNHGLLRFAGVSMVLLSPFFVYRAYKNIQLYQADDYLSLYLGGSPDGFSYKLGGWFILSVFAALAAKPGKMTAYVVAGLGLLFCVLESLTGARGIPMAHMLMLCWLLVLVLEIRVRWPTFTLIVLALILFADFMGRARFGVESSFDFLSLLDTVLGFIHSQGTTFLFVVGVADHLDQFTLLDAIKATFALPYEMIGSLLELGGSLSQQSLGVPGASLAHRVASLVNPEMYRDGMGMGGSVVGESMLHSLYFGPLVFGILTGLAMRAMHWVAGRSQLGLLWFSYSFSFMLLVPRENLLYFVVPGIKALVFILIFLLVKQLNEQLGIRTGSGRNGHCANLP